MPLCSAGTCWLPPSSVEGDQHELSPRTPGGQGKKVTATTSSTALPSPSLPDASVPQSTPTKGASSRSPEAGPGLGCPVGSGAPADHVIPMVLEIDLPVVPKSGISLGSSSTSSTTHPQTPCLQQSATVSPCWGSAPGKWATVHARDPGRERAGGVLPVPSLRPLWVQTSSECLL